MNNILSIFSLSMHRMGTSMSTWLLLSCSQFVLAWVFLVRTESWLSNQNNGSLHNVSFGVTDFVVMPLFHSGLLLLCCALPFLCSQHIAGEKQHNNWYLLQSSPLSPLQIVIAKYLSVLVYCIGTLVMIILMCAVLASKTTLDYGLLLTCSLFFILCSSTLIAVGLCIACLFNRSMPATISSLTLFLFLLNTHWFFESNTGGFFNWLSFKSHLQYAYQGLLNSHDVLFFICLSVLGIVLSSVQLENNV